MASSSIGYFLTLYLFLTTTLLLYGVSGQSHIFAEDQPHSSYTIYNGKYYSQPKKESSWANLFSLETLYNNPVVQTVLGWTDSFYGSSSSNETMGDELLSDTLSSPSHQQHAYAGAGQVAGQPPNQYQNNPYFKNHPNYMPQQQQQQQPNGNKYPPLPQPNYSQYQPQQQPSYRPTQEQQLYQQKQLQYQQQLYPYQFAQGNYGQQQQQPQFYGQSYGAPNMYGNPNVEIVNHLEAQGSMESLITAPQERHYQSPSYQPQQSIQSSNSKNSFDVNLDSKPSSPSYDNSTPKEETSTASSSGSSSGNGGNLDDYPCLPLNQWKWDGEYCIALGPYPTFACLPNDLVASGRMAICRNKIFFPNEP